MSQNKSIDKIKISPDTLIVPKNLEETAWKFIGFIGDNSTSVSKRKRYFLKCNLCKKVMGKYYDYVSSISHTSICRKCNRMELNTDKLTR